MALASPIEWTDATWNPVTGCDKVSPGCTHCYAERLSLRLRAMGNRNYRDGFAVTLQPHMLGLPLHWRQPRRIFVNSMSDLFHADISLDYIQRVFDVMRRASWHCFQVLTKRSERLRQLDSQLDWPPNVWMGVSVESEPFTSRIDDLRATHAAIRFLSLEPLLGPLDRLDLLDIHWAIVGGESGPGARPMDPSWVASIRDQCRTAGVAFFFKQWGGVNKKRTGRLLEGRTWDELPIARRDVPRNGDLVAGAVAAEAGQPELAPPRAEASDDPLDRLPVAEREILPEHLAAVADAAARP